MVKLTTYKRNRLPSSDFVFPESRTYPIPDESHARDALARVSANGTPEQKRAVCEAVNHKFPEIHLKHCRLHGNHSMTKKYKGIERL